ncbi:hypothetical protein Moror_15668 [Moniliophthora roreri MCA 2997]|uniref:Uncharacterized protein n=1 Tax=Moniliophthora roreri (strain MCA 2997) TaxID=1381753 RepID=V2WLU8_MONRO|nr:hypothetical protein Moror_15668 [Moniliophthora roreri MCA 2997]
MVVHDTLFQCNSPLLPLNSLATSETPTGSSVSLPAQVSIMDPTQLLIESLVADFGLGEEQQKTLARMYKSSTQAITGQGMPPVILYLALFNVSAVYQCFNCRFEGDPNMVSMAKMISDAQALIDNHWHTNHDENKSICLLSNERAYNPLHISYHVLEEDVFNTIEKNAKEFCFFNIFPCPIRMKVLRDSIGTVCSSVQNGFRNNIKKSIDNGQSLADFTYAMNKIYYRPGGKRYSKDLLIARNAILRHIMVDRTDVIWTEEPESVVAGEQGGSGENLEPQSPNSANGNVEFEESAEGVKKCESHKKKGKDFWSVVDKFFDDKMQKGWGEDISKGDWVKFLQKLVKEDNERTGDLP